MRCTRSPRAAEGISGHVPVCVAVGTAGKAAGYVQDASLAQEAVFYATYTRNASGGQVIMAARSASCSTLVSRRWRPSAAASVAAFSSET